VTAVTSLLATQALAATPDGRARPRVTVTVTAGSKTIQLSPGLAPEAPGAGRTRWKLAGPLVVRNHGGVLGRLNDIQLDGLTDSVDAVLHVVAGPSDTTFSITTSNVDVGTLVNPDVAASAGVTVTDRDGNGATLTGQLAGAKTYEAVYNGSTGWRQLVATTPTTNDDTAVTDDRTPLAGHDMISATVSGIQTAWRFSLSANDSASGSSRFSIEASADIPLLNRVGLLALVALLALLGIAAVRLLRQ
jgi:hypothetical protein